MRKRKRGFTLVELLAVIVILAVILVIAVPSIMSVIEDSKKGSLESSTKMIASSAETKHMSNQTLGITEDITCESVSNYSSSSADFKSCKIVFDSNGKATVTLIGKGRFDKLKCVGDRSNVTCEQYNPAPPATMKASDTWITSRPKYTEGEHEGVYTFDTTNVTEIEFVDSLPFSESECLESWNAGIDDTNNKVLACLIADEGIELSNLIATLGATYDFNPSYSAKLILAGNGNGIKANSDSSFMFAYYDDSYYEDEDGRFGTDWARLEKISGLDKLDTSNVTNMSYMFYGANDYEGAYLGSLDLSSFNTKNVTNMSYMFHYFPVDLDLSSFNTSKVENMSYMFNNAMGKLNLSKLNTSNVTNIEGMFQYYDFDNWDGPYNDLDLSGFDFSKVTNSSGIFDGSYINTVFVGEKSKDMIGTYCDVESGNDCPTNIVEKS